MITLLKKQSILYLLIIFVLAAFLRFYGLNWDQGNHLHPDERAIVMFTTPLQFPTNITEFISPQSTWNPHFFAYGSFPIYLLKITGNVLSIFNPGFSTYDQINIVGRTLSAFFDIGTLLVLFFLTKKLFNKKTALLAGFFYAVSVLPIQLSHFYAVDTLLTFFIILTLYRLMLFYEKPSVLNSILVGIFFGLSLATKISAFPLVIAVFAAIGADFALLVIKQPHKLHIWLPHVPRFLKRLMLDGFMIAVSTIITFSILQPYAIIDFQEFLRQNHVTSQVMHNAFAFPFTLQYVGKIPYLYELKNIFLWGMGPLLATLSFIGTIYISFKSVILVTQREAKGHPEIASADMPRNDISSRHARTIIILSFFWIYFGIVGHFATGFMRYMLPLYPLLCLFAAVLAYGILESFKHKGIQSILLYSLFFILIFAWPLSFMHIYTQPNTRVTASEWINKNIPAGKTLTLEHWDDSLPLYGQEKYQIQTLALYDPDTNEKWKTINSQLAQSDYIVIASNRLYVPLQKLTDCQKLPLGKCYTQTAQYYKDLFGKNLGFKKVKEFSMFPSLEIGNWKLEIRDEDADEAFTVYDHPKIFIFKKSR